MSLIDDLSLPAAVPSDGTWWLDYRTLNRIAAEGWGLRWPIHWYRRRYKGVQRWAAHTVYLSDGCHAIRFPGNMAAPFALSCIAHELEHAAQVERVGLFAFQYLYLTDQAGYETMAGKAEHRWRELLPAVKGAA